MTMLIGFIIIANLLKPALFHNVSISNLNGNCYSKLGDINIGVLMSLSLPSTDLFCSEDLASDSKPQYIEIVKYAVSEINSNKEILPNISLGYIIMDTCSRDIVALARAMMFIPDNKVGETPTEAMVNKIQSLECTKMSLPPYIVGILGPRTSRDSVLVASAMTLFQIPILAPFATSDELSDSSRFKYFMRLSPPDSIQAQVMTDLCLHYNWTYISLLYSEGSYGENGAKQIERQTRSKGICIAYMKKIRSDADNDYYKQVIDSLLENYKARAVILFLGELEAIQFFQNVETKGVSRNFIWIGPDSLSTSSKFGRGAHDMFSMLFTLGIYEPAARHYKTITPLNSSNNVWLYRLWQDHFHCKWFDGSCEDYANVSLPDQAISRWVSKHYDGIWVYAYALDALIRDKCPEASLDHKLLKDCTKGKHLLPYMKNVTFDGISGNIRFDENGNMMGEYDVFQYKHQDGDNKGKREKVGTWNRKEGLEMTDINLTILEPHSRNNKIIYGIPESLCSIPCLMHQYKIQKELICCWECHNCRSNEIIVNSSSCKECPPSTWPDSLTKRECIAILPTYIQLRDVLSVVLIVLTIIGLTSLLAILYFFIINKDVKLIRASSRELTAITSIGICLAYVSVFTFVIKPTTVSCYLSNIGFHISVTLIYAPLLLKTNRVFRIFAGGKKGKVSLKWTSSRTQLLITLFLFLLQVVLLSITGIRAPPVARSRMQVHTKKHVELFCDLPLVSLLLPLAYNLALIILCAVHGFLTRKLPENFNESWYIFVSVSTTTFLWVVFLPTYFTTFYAYYQVLLLAFCLILNATVTLLCLYIPKIYAIYFVDEDSLKFSGAQTGTTVASSNQIAPMADIN